MINLDAYQQSRIVGECSCGGNLVMKYSPRNKFSFCRCSNYPEWNYLFSSKGATFKENMSKMWSSYYFFW